MNYTSVPEDSVLNFRQKVPEATCRGGHRRHHHDYKSSRLKVLRDPATFTELSVIGSRGQSSNSDEEVRATNGIHDGLNSSRSPSPTPSPSPSPKQMANGNIRIAFQASPLEILTGTSGLGLGLEFTYTVVEQC